MTKLNSEMRKALIKCGRPAHAFSVAIEAVEAIANGTADDDTLSAQLVCWVAEGMEEFLYPDNEDNWPLFAKFAEMAVGLILAQHYATQKALTTAQNMETTS
jgi:hypothetical protein